MKTIKEIDDYLQNTELGGTEADLRLCNAVVWLCEAVEAQSIRLSKLEASKQFEPYGDAGSLVADINALKTITPT